MNRVTTNHETRRLDSDKALAMVDVIGLGAGGHAKVVLEILRSTGRFHVVGLLDPNRQLHGTKVLGVEILGGDERLARLKEEGVEQVFIGVGGKNSTAARARLYRLAVDAGMTVVSAIHPSAAVSPSARIGDGLTVMAGAVVNAEARVGNNVIINTGAIVEHDCVIADHVHVAVGAVLAGGVEVGRGTLVGVGASVRPCVKIGSGSVVGAGAVVVKDVPNGVVVIGAPARVARRLGRP